MIEFKRIILRDTFAYDAVEFFFESGIHSIVGVNGASKTSIYLALAQGLFNRNPKKTKIDEVSNDITKRPYEIVITFVKDGNEYEVINSRKRESISVTCNGKSISRKTIPQNLELIREILQDEYETFAGRTYQSIDSTLDLVEDTTDSARKAFINKILKYSELDEKLEETKDKIKQLKYEYKLKEKLVETLEASITETKPGLGQLDEDKAVAVIAACAAKLEKARDYKHALDTRVEVLRSKEKANIVYRNTQSRLASIEYNLTTLSIPHATVEQLEEKINDCKNTLTEAVRLSREASKWIDENRVPEVVCSKCGQDVDNKTAYSIYEKELAKYKEQLSVNKRLVDILSDNHKRLTTELEKWYVREALIKERDILLSTTVSYEEVSDGELEELQAKLVVATTEVAAATSKLAKSTKELADIKEHNSRALYIAKLNEEIKAKNTAIEDKLIATKAEIKSLYKRLDLLDNWNRLLGPTGYRVHKMAEFLNLLNVTMDKYSEMISGGKIKSRFFVTPEGKVDFSVTDPDKTISFYCWSNGEKARVKLSCLFAVLDILEIMGSSSCNILVLDEIFSALDDEGKEGLFNVLAYLRDKGKCIYTISHTPLVNQVVFDSTIQVTKTDGIASIC